MESQFVGGDRLDFSPTEKEVYQSYLGQHASSLAYTGYPGLCICMSLERFMDFPWISMCPSQTNLGKQTNKQDSILRAFGYRWS